MKSMTVVVPLGLGETVRVVRNRMKGMLLRVVAGHYEIGQGWVFAGVPLDKPGAPWFWFADGDIGKTVFPMEVADG